MKKLFSALVSFLILNTPSVSKEPKKYIAIDILKNFKIDNLTFDDRCKKSITTLSQALMTYVSEAYENRYFVENTPTVQESMEFLDEFTENAAPLYHKLMGCINPDQAHILVNTYSLPVKMLAKSYTLILESIGEKHFQKIFSHGIAEKRFLAPKELLPSVYQEVLKLIDLTGEKSQAYRSELNTICEEEAGMCSVGEDTRVVLYGLFEKVLKAALKQLDLQEQAASPS